jgi:hypothetical protein
MPADGQTVSGFVSVKAVPTVSGALPRVQFKLDDVDLGAEIQFPPYVLAWDSQLVANGLHELAAVTRDAAGNVATTVLTLRVQNPAIPQGVFSLTPPFGVIASHVLANPLVTGVTVRGQWPRIERHEGAYDWSYFDTQLGRAAGWGKQALLRIVAGGRHTPHWVHGLGVQTISFVNPNPFDEDYGATVTMPVFWDPVFLAKKRHLIAAMGDRFAGHPAVSLVSVQCAAALTDDWNVPDSPTDVANWLALGYTADKVVAACIDTVDATMTAFPDTLVVMAVGRTSRALDPDPDYVAGSITAYAHARYPGRFIVQKNSLSAATPDPVVTTDLRAWELLWDSQPHVGGQMLGPVTNDKACRMNGQVAPCGPSATLRQAVKIGAHYDMQYQELYQQDVRNPALAPVIRYAADVLSTPTPPANLSATTTATEVSLSWLPSEDTVAVTAYRIYRNGIEIAKTKTPRYLDQGRKPLTAYRYRVSAIDAAGNESPASQLTATTKTKPLAP